MRRYAAFTPDTYSPDTSPLLLRHCLCSGKKNLKRIYFGNRTRTLLCSLFLIYVATVVLEVFFYLGHYKIFNVM